MASNSSGRGDNTTARISKSNVDAMGTPPAESRRTLWASDVKGFGVRIAPSGARTCFPRRRMGGRETPRRMLAIGKHGSPWIADQARDDRRFAASSDEWMEEHVRRDGLRSEDDPLRWWSAA